MVFLKSFSLLLATTATRLGNLLEKAALQGPCGRNPEENVAILSGEVGSTYHSVKSTRRDLAFYGQGESKISADTRNHATNETPMNTNKIDGYTTWRIKCVCGGVWIQNKNSGNSKKGGFWRRSGTSKNKFGRGMRGGSKEKNAIKVKGCSSAGV